VAVAQRQIAPSSRVLILAAVQWGSEQQGLVGYGLATPGRGWVILGKAISFLSLICELQATQAHFTRAYTKQREINHPRFVALKRRGM
jgi:hypothetical protein